MFVMVGSDKKWKVAAMLMQLTPAKSAVTIEMEQKMQAVQLAA